MVDIHRNFSFSSESYVDQLNQFLDKYEEEHELEKLEPVEESLIVSSPRYKHVLKILTQVEDELDRDKKLGEKFSLALSRSTAFMMNLTDTIKEATRSLEGHSSQNCFDGTGDGQQATDDRSSKTLKSIGFLGAVNPTST